MFLLFIDVLTRKVWAFELQQCQRNPVHRISLMFSVCSLQSQIYNTEKLIYEHEEQQQHTQNTSFSGTILKNHQLKKILFLVVILHWMLFWCLLCHEQNWNIFRMFELFLQNFSSYVIQLFSLLCPLLNSELFLKCLLNTANALLLKKKIFIEFLPSLSF